MITAYLYPGCTSCRNAKAWLQQHVGAYEERHIYRDPPSRETLAALARLLPGGASDLLSRRGRKFRELGLNAPGAHVPEGDALLDLFVEQPRLLRRPILTDGKRAVVGWSAAAFDEAFGGGPVDGP